MKIKSNRNPASGQFLLIAMLVIGCSTVILASVFAYTASLSRSDTRAANWNASIAVAEAGVEEALSHIKVNGPSSGSGARLGTDGWSAGASSFTMHRDIDANTYYDVAISSSTPYIVNSTGYVKMPASPKYISRYVRVATTNDPIFLKGLVVKNGVTSNGNSVNSDAFDSQNPLYSTNGQYIASKATDGGGIATLSGAANALNFGGGTVYGRVATGPGGTIPGSLKVGTKAWLAANSGQEPGYVTSDMNVTFQSSVCTFMGATAPTQSKISATGLVYPLSSMLGGLTTAWVLTGTGGTNDFALTSGTALNGTLIVNGTGRVRLYVPPTCTVNFTASQVISISNSVSFEIYVAPASATLPNVANTAGLPGNFTYFGMPSNIALTMNVNADFFGTIYAPDTTITLGGNGTGSDQKIIGAVVAKALSYNDLFSFHYDMSLARIGMSRGYLMSSWAEL